MTDEELISGCKNNHSASQKAVFDRYASRMLGVCHRYARNHADAEDILQESFIKVFGKISQFKGEGSFEGWIRRIVVHTAIKKYSLMRYQKEQHSGDLKENAAMVSDPAAYQHLTEKDLLALINQLPDGYRLIFNLYVVEGYRHEEIADMLGIQPGTSRSQLVKARTMLQKQIIDLQKVAV